MSIYWEYITTPISSSKVPRANAMLISVSSQKFINAYFCLSLTHHGPDFLVAFVITNFLSVRQICFVEITVNFADFAI